jgi:hypothetical protein
VVDLIRSLSPPQTEGTNAPNDVSNCHVKLHQSSTVVLYTLEIKVFAVAPNTSTKLVLVLPVASLVSVMMKASSGGGKLTNIETCVVVAPPIAQKVEGMV